MLVVSRRIKESIVVGEVEGFDSVLKVTVLEVNEGKVKLSFEVISDLPATPIEEWRRHDALEAAAYTQPDEYLRPDELRELFFENERAHLTTEEIND